MQSLLAGILVVCGLAMFTSDLAAQRTSPADTVKFAVIGDGGTGLRPQYEIAARMAAARATFAFDLVLMLGDNFYGRQGPEELKQKFDRPYAPLLEAGVVFRAALGNHDDPDTRFYPPLNMNGERYYTFARGHVRFIAVDTNEVDQPQLRWLETTLENAPEPWKICYFHHPLYSSAGRHGSAVDLRVLLEPILVKHGVQAAWSGHDHAYERTRPQKGIHYFVSGSAGQLRRGDIRATTLTAASFDEDQSFMLVEVTDAELRFRTISRAGATVDAGVIRRQTRPDGSAASSGDSGARAGASTPIGTSRGVR
jgi:hypothetical protein